MESEFFPTLERHKPCGPDGEPPAHQHGPNTVYQSYPLRPGTPY